MQDYLGNQAEDRINSIWIGKNPHLSIDHIRRDFDDATMYDFSGIEGQEASIERIALAQYRVLQKKKGMEQFGGEKFTPTDQKFFDRRKKEKKCIPCLS